jgi:Ca2+-binding EF-hand superfamily protein
MNSAKYIFWVLTIISLIAADTALSEASQSLNSTEIMAVTDLDGNDRIDIEEYRHRITDVYFFLDTDKDGKLTVVEIQRSLPNLDPDLIDNADVNGNAIITIYEFRYVLYKDFDAMDKNKDGSLDQQEMKSGIGEK